MSPFNAIPTVLLCPAPRNSRIIPSMLPRLCRTKSLTSSRTFTVRFAGSFSSQPAIWTTCLSKCLMMVLSSAN